VRHRRRMPFGAEVLENGETRFSLWVPGDRYRIDGGQEVPDPASRYQPEDVHGPSAVVDPEGFDWRDDGWKGRPWEGTVLYELHVGTFSPEGTLDGVKERLANPGPEPLGGFDQAVGELLHATGGATGDGPELPGWSVAWYLREAG
jgi:1,4-alpha-glucan branching enzyme